MTTDSFRRYGNLLRADGTNQLQRLLPALEADYIVPDERSLSDLVEYARGVAAEIRFYDLAGQPTGDWAPFLELLLDPTSPAPARVLPSPQLEAALDVRTDWPPHLVLFLAFLKLFQNLQGDLNQLTERHLRHYYEKELGLQRRAAASDDVHVVFELARNAPPTLLRAGTLLDAGKDAEGRPLTYATQTDVMVSAARLNAIRRLVMERDRRLHRRFFVAEAFTDLEGTGGFTFGRTQLDLDPAQRFMIEAPLGFAVAAPILQLAEGERQITLLAHLRVPPPSAPPVISQGIGYALDVTLTGAEGWLVPDTVQADLLADGGSGQPAIALTVTLGVASAAVVAFDDALHGPGTSIDGPVLRCLVKGDTGIYDVLDGLVVESIELSVDVKGVRNLVVQNADGPLDANQAMPLFGSQPQIGALFYVGSAEVFSKRLTSLDLRLKWKAPPADLFDHYRAYFDHLTGDLILNFHTFFQADVALCTTARSGSWSLVTCSRRCQPTRRRSRSRPATSMRRSWEASIWSSRISNSRSPSPLAASTALYGWCSPARPGSISRRLPRRCRSMPSVTTRFPGGTRPKRSPSAKSAVIDRAAQRAIHAGAQLAVARLPRLVSARPRRPSQHRNVPVVGPFGATPASDRAAARLVPHIDGEAALFLGIDRVAPPANLSMFFQIDVGTATSATVLKSGDTEWSYLAAGDSWRPLSSSAVLIDSTEGFQKPGLIPIAVPRDASLAHHSLPSDMVWLRGLIRRPPDSAARTLAVRTHAALARFQPGALPLENFEQHLVSGLPAGTITRLVQPNANISRVEQPNASFGGRATEGARNISGAAASASSSQSGGDGVGSRAARARGVPGRLQGQVSAAHRRNRRVRRVTPLSSSCRTCAAPAASNVLEPRAGAVLMGRIEEHVAGLTSPFATMHVIHPVFERIRVEANVVFTTGRDPGYYAKVLNDELRRFLSPWAFQEGEDILFGAQIYRSEILAFIEGRAYVDHLVGLQLYHSFAGAAGGASAGWRSAWTLSSSRGRAPDSERWRSATTSSSGAASTSPRPPRPTRSSSPILNT